ncbi:MAG: xylan 1,4-beta-xylosidase [Oscillospiraceae bacterium]|nr:xylan 1,4-beta-xylosidase [Oscillospiraceae bacterium]
MDKNRFEKVYTQGAMDIVEIWVDKQTGVNYLYHRSGYSGGLTPLLDRDGKPVVTLGYGFVAEKSE